MLSTPTTDRSSGIGAPQSMSPVEDAERHLVVAGEHGVDIRGGRQQAVEPDLAASRGPVALDDAATRRRRGPRSARVSRQPRSRSRASHQLSGPVMIPIRRAPPSRRCSVAMRPIARLSIAIEGSELWPDMPPTSSTGTGKSRPFVCDQVRFWLDLGDGPDDPVHLPRRQVVEQPVDAVHLRLMDEVERHRVAHLGGLLLDPGQHPGRPEVLETVGDHAECPAPSLDEPTGEQVRRVPGVLDDPLDALEGLRRRRRAGC